MNDEAQAPRGVKGLGTLRLPGFGRLAVASLVNELGNWLGEIALAIVVFDQTGSPVATAGLFVAMQFVPAIATPPARRPARPAPQPQRADPALPARGGGVPGARGPRGRETFVLAAVLAVAAFDGTLATAARARTRATAASILEPHGLLREGNGILNIGFTAGAAVGPALAGLLVSTAGAQVALARGRGVVPCGRRCSSQRRARSPRRTTTRSAAGSSGCDVGSRTSVSGSSCSA